ncbi:nitroreductase family protein [Thalassotalea maritima]|uniref:nitroreductase family protein n=1 Tax=Thalassotalea maritima TaxID=3242416 RepID=UPI003528654C
MSNALQFLINRQSNGFLEAPAPNHEQLQQMFAAAVAVPDHGALMPYRFDVVTGDGLDELTNIFVEAVTDKSDDDVKIAKAHKMAYRAPMIIVVSTKYQQHPKVPKFEQLITAGLATNALQMAATALGFGAIWRTGDMATSEIVKQGLNIALEEQVVGFLYVGSISKQLGKKPRRLENADIRYIV